MNRLNGLFLLLFFVGTTYSFEGKIVIPDQVEKVTHLLLKQDYEGAERIIQRTPHSLEDSLFLEILLNQAKMVDYESYKVDGRDFLALCDSARTVFKKIEEYKRPSHLFYYLGTLEGAAALTRGKRGDLVGALTASNISKKNLELAVKRDSTFVASYFGIGMREFYSASLYNKIGLAKKRLKSAVVLMEKSAEDSSALALSVLPSLFWTYLDIDEFEKAELVAERYLKVYPKSSVMLRGVQKMHLLNQKFTATEALAHRLMKSSLRRSPQNWSDYYSGGVSLVSVYIGEEQYRKAADEASRLLALEHDTKILKLEWVKKHRNHLKKLKEKAVLQL